MNPELEGRLRNYGATVDAAANAAETRRGATTSSAVADLDNFVALNRHPHRVYRALAIAAAAVAVLAGGIIFAVSRSTPSTGIADRPISSTAPAAAAAAAAEITEPAGHAAPPPIPGPPTTAASSTAPVPTRPTTPPVCASYTPTNDYHLDICDSGPAVRLVQERLRASVDSSLNVDGYFGPGTRNAVRTFQQMHGLTVDGQVGPATWALLVPDATGIDADGNGVVDPDEISTG